MRPMERSSSTMSRRIGLNAHRLWWALLIAIHIPILANVGRTLFLGKESGSWLAFIALLVTVLLFALKFIDVRFLRFRTRRNGALVFIVACLFVHNEVTASEVTREVLQQSPMVLVFGVIAVGARAARRQLRDLWRDLHTTFARQLVIAHPHGAVVAEPPLTVRWFINSRLAIPRAPPI